MAATKQVEKNKISLKGSAQLVSEYFYYGVNNILYQRGVLPSDDFSYEQQYDLTVLVTRDTKVQEYLNNVISQIKDWLEQGQISRLVLVISNVDTTEPLERWEFEVQKDDECINVDSEKKPCGNKELKEIQKSMRDVMRQITASVTFLPLLDCPVSFNLLVYTKVDCEVSDKWDDAPPCIIPNAENVKLKSFSTSVHKVSTSVSYKMNQ